MQFSQGKPQLYEARGQVIARDREGNSIALADSVYYQAVRNG